MINFPHVAKSSIATYSDFNLSLEIPLNNYQETSSSSEYLTTVSSDDSTGLDSCRHCIAYLHNYSTNFYGQLTWKAHDGHNHCFREKDIFFCL